MDIYTLIEFYLNDQITIQELKQRKESYEDIEIRMGKRISKNLKQEIEEMISRIVQQLQTMVQKTISYKRIIIAYIESYTQDEKTLLYNVLKSKAEQLEQPIAITEYDLNKMAFVGKYQEYVTMCNNILIKQSMVPEEYRQKTIYLQTLRTKKATYEEILELLRQYKQNTPMKP